MSKTKIEWVRNPDGSDGFTWNPVSGCAKVSDGCKHCYAETVAHRFWGDRKFTDVKCHEDKLTEPLKRKKPIRVFVNSMSDLFHESVPYDFINRVFTVMALAPQHTFMILTKRPERMKEWFETEYYSEYLDLDITSELDVFQCMGDIACDLDGDGRLTESQQQIAFDPNYELPWPLKNVWIGVSVEDQKTADERISLLLATPAAIRFVSYEPALGPVDFEPYLIQWQCPECLDWQYGSSFCDMCEKEQWENLGNNKTRGLDWIIAGGESGSKARPSHPDWFRSVRDQCEYKHANVSFFFKQWGEWAPKEVTVWDEKIKLDLDRMQGSQNGKWHPEFDIFKIGKKAAGRLLDGQLHDEWPEVKA